MRDLRSHSQVRPISSKPSSSKFSPRFKTLNRCVKLPNNFLHCSVQTLPKLKNIKQPKILGAKLSNNATFALRQLLAKTKTRLPLQCKLDSAIIRKQQFRVKQAEVSKQIRQQDWRRSLKSKPTLQFTFRKQSI